jgi:acyl dehydratase
MHALMTIADIVCLLGKPVGTSSWITVDQDRINRFADVTNDHQFIHVDPVAAQASPFGGTIAHGLLTLSLLPSMAYEVMPVPAGTKMSANYGYDKIRFITPVRSGSRVRGHFKLLDFSETKPGRWQQTTEVTVEIEGEEKPALIADWIGQHFL